MKLKENCMGQLSQYWVVDGGLSLLQLEDSLFIVHKAWAVPGSGWALRAAGHGSCSRHAGEVVCLARLFCGWTPNVQLPGAQKRDWDLGSPVSHRVWTEGSVGSRWA